MRQMGGVRIQNNWSLKRAGNSKSCLYLYGDARILIHEKFIMEKDINPILIFLND